MKLILGNLTQLKVFLLNESLRSDTQWDEALQVLGKGIARRFQTECNRQFELVEDDLFETSADRAHVFLPRVPVEEISAIETRSGTGDTWQSVSASVQVQDLAKGYVEFGANIGTWLDRLRFTYTGGFWVPNDDAETPETDEDLPEGSTLVPEDLRLAWLLQCQRTWSVRDNLGVDVSGERSVQFVSSTLAGLELVPEVKAMLRPFIRYALT